ncbi:CU044_5270 family protein [Spirillospora sp. NPDC052269]
MDELDALRLLAADPTEETTAEGRALLEAEARGPARRRARRFSLPRPALFTGFGLTLAGAAAAVAVMMSSGTATPRAPGAHGGGPLADGAFMDVAAKADLLPTGRYWYSDEIQGQSYMQRPKTGPYAIIGAHSEILQYVGAKRKDGSAFWGRDLAARPATPEDEAAWKRAGSPSSFRVWSNDHYYVYRSKPTAWVKDSGGQDSGGRFPRLGPRPQKEMGKPLPTMTVEDFAKLPTDPSTLAGILFPKLTGMNAIDPLSLDTMTQEQVLKYRAHPDRIPPREMSPWQKVLAAGDALKDMPLPPKVRSGLMRALAMQPGVHTVKNVRDPLGREGVALRADPEKRTRTGEFGTPKNEQGTYKDQEELIFDPKTGALLSQQLILAEPGGPYAARKPGSVIFYWIVRSGGWTNSKPTPTAKLPF